MNRKLVILNNFLTYRDETIKETVLRTRRVSNGLCEHASSAFIFASTSTDQFSHASGEHFRNYKWRAASTS